MSNPCASPTCAQPQPHEHRGQYYDIGMDIRLLELSAAEEAAVQAWRGAQQLPPLVFAPLPSVELALRRWREVEVQAQRLRTLLGLPEGGVTGGGLDVLLTVAAERLREVAGGEVSARP